MNENPNPLTARLIGQVSLKRWNIAGVAISVLLLGWYVLNPELQRLLGVGIFATWWYGSGFLLTGFARRDMYDNLYSKTGAALLILGTALSFGRDFLLWFTSL
jgi:hypothetical protein